jgi:hypothetical protein
VKASKEKKVRRATKGIRETAALMAVTALMVRTALVKTEKMGLGALLALQEPRLILRISSPNSRKTNALN